jgi:D-alanyl-D-alanine carboxypeptidase/D-alanyl-D-alanine-endopeptidase (penicillin-binding protein 4)
MLTVGIATAHADPPRAPAGSSRSSMRRARAVSVPSLRSRGSVAESIGIGRAQASPESELASELRKLESERTLRRGTTAIYVVDVSTGRPVYAVHEDEPLNPASNVKLISTATALDVLGPDWRYATRVLGPAPGSDGTVAGDLYLLGSYDPTLRPAHLDELATALASAGITRVQGDIVVGPEALRDSLSFARIDVRVHGRPAAQPPAGSAGAATGVGPEDLPEVTPEDRPEVSIDAGADFLAEDMRAAFLAQTFEIDVQAQTTRRRRSRIDVQVSLVAGPTPRYRVEVTGTIGKDSRARSRRRLPVPQIFTAQLLRAALAQAGITVQGAVRASALDAYVAETTAAGSLPIELARHESQPLSRLVASINKRSLNTLSDRVIMTAGAVMYGGAPSMDKGVRAMQAWLREHAGLDPSRVVLDSGSGLSKNTELTARQLVRVLRVAGGLLAPEPSAAPAPSMEEMMPPALAGPAEPLGMVAAAGPGVALIGMLDDQAGLALVPDPASARSIRATSPKAGQSPHLASGQALGLSDEIELEESEETDSASEVDPVAAESPALAGAPAPPAPASAPALASTPADAFLHSLSVGGVDGTLRHRFHELRGQVQAKTGTLNKAVALSGLVRHGDDTLAFAIVTNGTDWRQRKRVRRQHERLVEALHRYLRKRAAVAAAE